MAKRKKDAERQNKGRFRVVRGKKSYKGTFFLGAVCLLVLAVVLFYFLTPTGIYEYVQNAYALSVDSGDNTMTDTEATVNQFEAKGNAIHLLSSTYYEVFNKNANNILYFKHGFSDPVMDVSDARVLIYDRGGKNFKIFNNYTVLLENSAPGRILSGDIARNGTTAILSTSDGYASQLTVWNAKLAQSYIWHSNEHILSSVCLQDSGRKVAVCETYVDRGILSSKIDLLKVGADTPYATVQFGGVTITSLSLFNGDLLAASDNCLYFIRWNTGEYTTKKFDGVLTDMQVVDGNELMVAYSRSDNQAHHSIVLLDNKTNEIGSIQFNAVLSDLAAHNRRIYALYDNRLTVYNLNGEITDTKTSTNTIQRIAYLSGSNKVAVCSTSQIGILE